MDLGDVPLDAALDVIEAGLAVADKQLSAPVTDHIPGAIAVIEFLARVTGEKFEPITVAVRGFYPRFAGESLSPGGPKHRSSGLPKIYMQISRFIRLLSS